MTAGEVPVELPAWLEPLRVGAREIRVDQLTRFAPPADADPRWGAVLILFSGTDLDSAELLLTERAHDMRSHPGQVSFPGGSLDPGETAVQAALREAEEETGLDPTGVRVFGTLPDLYLPPSNFAVTPVLGFWPAPGPVGVVDPAEVHAVLPVRVDDLLDPAHRVTVEWGGYRSPGFQIGPAHDVLCWGFTAGILARLFDYLDWARPWDTARTTTLPEHMVAGVERARAQAQWRVAAGGTGPTPHDGRDADVDVPEEPR